MQPWRVSQSFFWFLVFSISTTMAEAETSSFSSSSSSSSTLRMSKTKTHRTTPWFDEINGDVLQNILERLPAVWFASATCVSKQWNRVCNRILSRPKLASALSLNPSLDVYIFLPFLPSSFLIWLSHNFFSSNWSWIFFFVVVVFVEKFDRLLWRRFLIRCYRSRFDRISLLQTLAVDSPWLMLFALYDIHSTFNFFFFFFISCEAMDITTHPKKIKNKKYILPFQFLNFFYCKFSSSFNILIMLYIYNLSTWWGVKVFIFFFGEMRYTFSSITPGYYGGILME